MKYDWGWRDQQILEEFLDKHKNVEELIFDVGTGLPIEARYHFSLYRIIENREEKIKGLKERLRGYCINKGKD